MISSRGLEFWLEEITVGIRSRITGKPISDSHIGRDTGALLLAIVRADGTRVANPHAHTVLEAGDTLIAIGTRDELRHLEQIASDITIDETH